MTTLEEERAASTRGRRRRMLVFMVVSVPFMIIGSAYFNGYINMLGHWVLRGAIPIQLAPSNAFRTASLGSTLKMAKLGSFFLYTPRLVAAFLPLAFVLDECVDADSAEPLDQWSAKVLKPVPPVVLSALDNIWGIAPSAVGVWLSRYWLGEDTGLDIWHAIMVGVVARGGMTVWDVAAMRIFPRRRKLKPLEGEKEGRTKV